MNSVILSILVLTLIDYSCSRHTGQRKWQMIDEGGLPVEVIPAELFHREAARRSIGHEVVKRCKCYCRRKWDREYVCCDCADSTCFPATATVTMATGESRRVGNITVGERILTADDDGQIVPTVFLGYMQRESDVISEYVTIETETRSMSLSRSHLVFVSDTGKEVLEFAARYAYEVEVGDYVLVRSDNNTSSPSQVKAIHLNGAKGAFVPLTDHGTLFVDGVKASCYASFPHVLAHVAMAPLRWLPGLLSLTPATGTNPYMAGMKAVGRAVLPGSLVVNKADVMSATQHFNNPELTSRVEL